MAYLKDKISVVVPVYNTASFLDRCIESLLQQSVDFLEIVLVDDGSDDQSGQICDKYGVENENVIVLHQTNQGPGIARRNGVRAASGMYVGFVDSDDWVDSGMYEKLGKYMTEYNADLICSGMCRDKNDITMNRWSASDFAEGLYRGESLDKLKRGLFGDGRCWINGSMCNKLFVRNELMQIMDEIDSRLFWGEDRAVTLSYLLQSNAIYLSDESFYHGTERQGSATNSEQPEAISQTNFLYVSLKNAVMRTPYSDQILPKLDEYYIGEILHGISQTFPGKYDFRLSNKAIEAIGRDIVIYGAGEVGSSLYYYFKSG